MVVPDPMGVRYPMRVARLLLLGMLLGSTSLVSAQDDANGEDVEERPDESVDQSARRVYIEGRTAFDEGRYEDALRLFEAAYGLSPRPELLYNIGTAADRLRRNERALEAFEQYLEELPHSDLREPVQSRVRVLRAEIEQQRALEESLRRAEERPQPEPKRKWWIGVLVGGLALAATAVTLGVVLTREESSGYQTGDEGRLIFTLTRTP